MRKVFSLINHQTFINKSNSLEDFHDLVFRLIMIYINRMDLTKK